MDRPVLIAYATRYGSTEETARVVASVLGAEGLAVEVRSVEQIADCAPFSAVVLTAALYVGKLHKGARRFLRQFRSALQQVPVVLIVPGPVNNVPREFAGAQEQLDKELAHFPWLCPVVQKVVGGKWDPAKAGSLFRWMMRKQPPHDARDWPAIRAFARELAAQLQPTVIH